jgi:hypothetical protein
VNLDDDLAAWAAAVRLPDADADAIFRRITASPVGPQAAPVAASTPTAAGQRLKPSWWRAYNAGFAARMVASTSPARLAA